MSAELCPSVQLARSSPLRQGPTIGTTKPKFTGIDVLGSPQYGGGGGGVVAVPLGRSQSGTGALRNVFGPVGPKFFKDFPIDFCPHCVIKLLKSNRKTMKNHKFLTACGGLIITTIYNYLIDSTPLGCREVVRH